MKIHGDLFYILVFFYISIAIEHGHLSLIYVLKIGYFPVRELFVYRGFGGGWMELQLQHMGKAMPNLPGFNRGELRLIGSASQGMMRWEEVLGGGFSRHFLALLGVFLWLVGGDWNHGI